jgi:hypothetical protein
MSTGGGERVEGEAAASSRGLSTRAIAVIAIAVVGLCLAGLWAGLLVGEVRGTHRALEGMSSRDALRHLGGPERAAQRLSGYLSLPAWAAPRKEAAVRLLGRCGEPAVPVLARIFRRRDPELHLAALQELWDLRHGASRPILVAALVEALGSADPGVRAVAAGYLGYYGAAAAGAVPQLAAMTGDPDRGVRLNAVYALGRMGPAASAAAAALEEAARDPEDSVVREYAAWALKQARGEE